MAKRDIEDLVKVTGIKAAEITGVEDVDEGVVVSSRNSPPIIVLDDDKLPDDGSPYLWYGSYGEKPPNFNIGVYDPATKKTSRPKPPERPSAKK